MPTPEKEGLRSPNRLKGSGGKGGFLSGTLITTTPGFSSLARVPPCKIQLVVENNRRNQNEGRGNRLRWAGEGETVPFDDPLYRLRKYIHDDRKTIHILGIGNPIKQDDAVGLEVVGSLRRLFSSRSAHAINIHAPSLNPEGLISKLASRGERIIIIDAVEARKEPGTIVCARLSDTKFGFFATHNIPLKLVPGVAQNASDIFVIGIQPASVAVGEGLSKVVSESSGKLISMIAGLVGGAR